MKKDISLIRILAVITIMLTAYTSCIDSECLRREAPENLPERNPVESIDSENDTDNDPEAGDSSIPFPSIAVPERSISELRTRPER